MRPSDAPGGGAARPSTSGTPRDPVGASAADARGNNPGGDMREPRRRKPSGVLTMMLLRSIPHSGGNLLPLGLRESRNPAGDGCDRDPPVPVAQRRGSGELSALEPGRDSVARDGLAEVVADPPARVGRGERHVQAPPFGGERLPRQQVIRRRPTTRADDPAPKPMHRSMALRAQAYQWPAVLAWRAEPCRQPA